MISTTLVVGASSADREQAIAKLLGDSSASDSAPLTAPHKSAILLEGLSDGNALLTPDENHLIARIAAGCLCCSNQMIMRIYLNRMIQQKPHRLFLSLSNSTHLEQITAWLSSPDYAQVLKLTPVLTLR